MSKILIASLSVALVTLSAAPSMAAFPVLKYNPGIIRALLCLQPDTLERECVSWGPAQPGQLFGPCLKYKIECVAPANIQ